MRQIIDVCWGAVASCAFLGSLICSLGLVLDLPTRAGFDAFFDGVGAVAFFLLALYTARMLGAGLRLRDDQQKARLP